ncbi:MAG: hypothetical protein ACYDCX_12185 [Acidithiobacillus sp.]
MIAASRALKTVRIEVWIAESAMESLARHADAEGIPAGRRLAEALLSFLLDPRLSSGEVITLHVAEGEHGRPR